ncbi:CocE/NonD family hydrolase C-terminal non-catalytic domain-containing protein [Streptomyces sp. NPDC047061]|uniref:CocE/NonD family hydrolase C-terminal non-catalytic domain-containing protein n=1 Tax=Streptomyces sp. NPDC047061 TaxID=3154605 RepID=UPI0033D7E8C5
MAAARGLAQASERPVTPGRTTRYDISLLPSLTRIPAGYRIRVSLAGGLYTVERSAEAASFVNLPLTSPGTAHPNDSSWGPAS